MSNQRPTRDSMSLEEATCLQHVGECGAARGRAGIWFIYFFGQSRVCGSMNERDMTDPRTK